MVSIPYIKAIMVMMITGAKLTIRLSTKTKQNMETRRDRSVESPVVCFQLFFQIRMFDSFEIL